jgi:aminoglycoside 6'-N-acetyltransferase I
MRDDEFGPWGEMRLKLWPDCAPHDNAADMADLADPDGALRAVFLAFDGEEAVGFAELSERSVVDSCGNAPAAYLEGWYVAAEWRGKGVGSALIRQASQWARNEGYDWLGSDAEIENSLSQKAHAALGFEETGRVVKYRMKVGA